MFNRILIANRGEAALRVLRACQELGIETVIVYSESDKDSIYLKQGAEGICIGPDKLSQSYLNIPAIISAAEISDVDAIHPGQDMLAENPQFVEICESHQIKFIGPSPATLSAITDKSGAKKIAGELRRRRRAGQFGDTRRRRPGHRSGPRGRLSGGHQGRGFGQAAGGCAWRTTR